jgi:CheY-like chemotaxis protein
LLVDDDAGFRAVAGRLLESRYEVVEVADPFEVVATTRRLRPALVLLDVDMPGLDGFAVADLLARLGEPPTVVLISAHDPRVFRRRLAAAPVRAFIPKADLSMSRLDVELGQAST